MGVNEDPPAKANEDYRKRSAKPLGVDPATSTFVFVTPRVWVGKNTWIASCKADGVWGDVRVIDGQVLSEWIDLAPAIGVWFNAECGRPVQDIDDVKGCWRRTIEVPFGTRVTPELVICGRLKEATELCEWLINPTGDLVVSAETLKEVPAFVAAVACREEGHAAGAADRVLFARGRECVHYLGSLQTRHSVVLMDPELLAELKAVPLPLISLIIPVDRESAPRQSERLISLPRLRREDLDRELQAIGCRREIASRMSRESRGVLEAALWAVSPQGITGLPWLQGPTAGRLVPLVLAGQWIATEEPMLKDREVLGRLADAPYNEVHRLAKDWSVSDGPLQIWGRYWDWKARRVAWEHLAPHMTVDVVQRFREVTLNVLGTRDPSLDLAPEERGMASILKKTHPYSAKLRAGLVESIAMLAVTSDRLNSIDGSAISSGIVRKLLEHDPLSDSWQSLAPWLPELAEAAPEEFLAAAERVAGRPDVVEILFAESGPFGTSCRVHILWALERLAWSAEYLSRTVILLGRFAQLDPGGTSGNRPHGSLFSIFVPWIPSTRATLEERLAAFKQLCKRCPDQGWDCGVAVLPRDHQTAMPTSRPEFRDWAERRAERPPAAENFTFVNAVIDELLNMAGSRPDRWRRLASVIPVLMRSTPDHAALVVTAIENLDTRPWAPEDRVALWELLREQACLHAQYPDAFWSVDGDDLGTLQRLVSKHAPGSPRDQFRWLFASNPKLGESPRLTWEEEQKRLDDAKHKAVTAVLAADGLDGVLRWADLVEKPEFLGCSLASCELSEAAVWQVINDTLLASSTGHELNRQELCAANFVYCLERLRGEEWGLQALERVRASREPMKSARFALSLAPRLGLWRALDHEPELAGRYWMKASLWRASLEDAEFAVPRLIAVGRRTAAIHLLGLLTHERKRSSESPDESRLLSLAMLAMAELPELTQECEVESLRMPVPIVLDLIEELSGDSEEANRLVVLWEWNLLHLLRSSHRGLRVLCRELSRSPEFFVEVLSLLYRSKPSSAEDVMDKENESAETEARARLERAWYLLQAWRLVPGLALSPKNVNPLLHSSDFEGSPTEPAVKGQIDEAILAAWIKRARELALNAGRIDACDREIGRLFAYAPADPDGAWPARAVRTVIEELQSPELDEAMTLEIENRRGVHSRGNTGDAERVLRDKYRAMAARIDAESPRTAAIVNRVAKRYDAEATAEDAAGHRRDFAL